MGDQKKFQLVTFSSSDKALSRFLKLHSESFAATIYVKVMCSCENRGALQSFCKLHLKVYIFVLFCCCASSAESIFQKIGKIYIERA